jgi:hypothetical protein
MTFSRILSHSTVAVALWVMTPNVTVSPNLVLSADAFLDGGVGGVTTNNPVWKSRAALTGTR